MLGIDNDLHTWNDLHTLADGQLIALARRGSHEAFDIVINRHYGRCVNIASLILHDRGDAQDEVQKACCKAFEHFDQYHGDAEFITWLMRIVSNQCRMLIRTRQRARFLYIDTRTDRENSVPIELPAPVANPEQTLMSQESHDILRREIRCIPPLFRNVLLLHDVQELPISDVAARLKITVPAAKSRLLRARIELKERVMRRYGKLVPKKQKTPVLNAGQFQVLARAPQARVA